jgi:FixJ family two-component response regulator
MISSAMPATPVVAGTSMTGGELVSTGVMKQRGACRGACPRLSNKAIAARLHISTHTVKSHVRNLMEKLTLHTRLQLASWVYHEDDAES